MVREEGLEPTRPRTLEPKSSASANSATLARNEYCIECAFMCQLFTIKNRMPLLLQSI